MGLSYRLDATEYNWWSNLLTWMADTGGQEYMMGSLVQPAPMFRWMDNLGQADIVPTGEYIIRDGYYHNGIYIIVGSYRGYFKNLGGVPGMDDYAWDGFVLMHRGYNVTFQQNTATNFSLTDYTLWPMRFPIESDYYSLPALDDDQFGLYSLTPLKSSEDRFVGDGSGQENLQFAVCGYHLAPTARVPLDATSVGAVASFQFTADVAGVELGSIFYDYSQRNSLLIGYQLDQGRSFAQTTFGIYRNWEDVMAMGVLNLGPGAIAYMREAWFLGQKPDGTNPIGGPTSTNNALEPNGYLPIKLFGIDGVATITYDITKDAYDGVLFLTGQMATTDSTKNTEYTCPFVAQMEINAKLLNTMWMGHPPFDYQGPFTAAICAYTSTMIPGIANPYGSGTDAYQTGWNIEDTTDGVTPNTDIANLVGAAAVSAAPPAENLAMQLATTTSPILIGVGNMLDEPGGNRQAALFQFAGELQHPFPILPYASPGDSQFNAETSITLPSGGWRASLQQFRTYTPAEEQSSKRTVSGPTGEIVATPASCYDRDVEQYVGYIGNYPRYDTGPPQGFGYVGTPSYVGYSWVGYYDPADALGITGPCLFAYDKGTPKVAALTLNTSPIPPNTQGAYTTQGSVRQDGASLNAGVIAGASPTRSCDWAQWDNDRDQWLFVVSDDTTGVNIISVDAPFTTFLDHSATFYPRTNNVAYTTAKYFSISMSDAMDGLVIFGDRVVDEYGNTGVVAVTSGTVTLPTPWDPLDTYDRVATSELPAYRIKGSTGRTARVWIDYMLYDGVDSVIAMQLRDWGMRVTVENVEWFKARILHGGDLKAKGEEIEEWMEEQGRQYQDMLKQKERSGRLRRRRSQVSAYKREVGDLMTPDQMDTQVYDFVPQGIAAQQRLKDSEGALKEVPPDSIEAMVERDYRAGFDTTPSGLTEPGEQPAEDPSKPAGTFMDTGDAPEKQPGEGGDPDEEYISED